jgi:hypothetical protein
VENLKLKRMKKIVFLLFIALTVLVASCNKDTVSDRFTFLTGHIWMTDSLLAGGIDASGAGQLLEKFAGDIKFNEDGTGYFGQYTGTWRFVYDETSIVLESPELPVPLTALIKELTATSLKLTTNYPNLAEPSNPLKIRMTFKPK